MKTFRSWFARLFGLFRQDQRDREFGEEMENHLAMHIEDNLRLGMSPEESRRSAFIKLGGIDKVTEECRDRRGLPFIESLFRDIHYACRTLYRNPGFTLTVVALLALGMGGATAVFNPIYSLVVAPLPFPQPDRLVRIGGNIPLFNTRHSDFEKRELLARTFSNLTAYGIEPDLILRIRMPDAGKNADISPMVVVTEERSFLKRLESGLLEVLFSDGKKTEIKSSSATGFGKRNSWARRTLLESQYRSLGNQLHILLPASCLKPLIFRPARIFGGAPVDAFLEFRISSL